jgi:hypothetical protein|tara:strand:+ start:322 stop:1218 length:897 start_codon:yes stop_codon:yes gene_type:complete
MSTTNNNNFWLFGDSFTAGQPEDPPAASLSWFRQVHAKINETTRKDIDLHNFSATGSSIEYTFKNILQAIPHMQPGDFAVFQLTQSSRRWFVKDRPDWGNIHMREGYNLHDIKPIVTAIDMYKEHLQDDLNDQALYQSFIGFCNYIASIKRLRYVVIPGFPEAHIEGIPVMPHVEVSGNLTKISTEEFGSDQDEHTNLWKQIMIEKWQGCDQRLNHLSPENHELVAYRVYETLMTGKRLDLISDFKKDCVNLDNWKEVNKGNIYSHVLSIDEDGNVRDPDGDIVNTMQASHWWDAMKK